VLIAPGTLVASTDPAFHLCTSLFEEAVTGEEQMGVWLVQVRLSELGASRFERFTDANIGEES
jgi:preprotein translocase subunit SecD